MKQNKSDLIQKGDMYKVLLNLSIPIMINSIIQTLYNLVDGIWVSKISSVHFAATSFVCEMYFPAFTRARKIRVYFVEPFYNFEIYAEETYMGRIMSDIQKLRGTCEAPVLNCGNVFIKGRGPVESFMDYSVDLISFTKGTGSISLMYDGYGVCENTNDVILRIGYDKERDVENTSTSVFCAKGTSFTVPWYEAENYMHTK